MVELVRTNDLVLISLIETLLDEAGIAFFVADRHMSAVEGSLGFLPRRILVHSEDVEPRAAAARRSRARRPNCAMPETSLDEISGLGLRLRQMRTGHRVGADAVLLAAAAGPPAASLVDVGAGVGAVGLALLKRWPEAIGDLVEIDPELAELARQNAAENGIGARARALALDVLSRAGPPRRRARRTARPNWS